MHPAPWHRRPTVRVLLAAAASLGFATALGGGVLALMEGADNAGRRLVDLSPGWLFISLAVWTASVAFQAMRWRALLPVQTRPPTRTLAWIVLGANATTLALPGPVGELAAAWYLRRRFGVPMVTALAATLLGRFLALLVFGVATLALWPLRASTLPAEVVALVTPIAVVTGLVTLPIVFLCWRPGAMVQIVGRILTFVLRGERAARIASRVDWWARCFAAVGHIPARRWGVAAAACLCNLAVLSGSTMLTLRAAGMTADPLGTVFVQALTAVASVAGLLVPGGFGAVEILVVALFPTFSTGTTADAVFAALTLRWVHLATLLLGIPAMTWLVATLPADPEKLAPILTESLEGELGA